MTAVIALVAATREDANEWAKANPDLAPLCRPILMSEGPRKIDGLRVCHIIWVGKAGLQPGFMAYKVALERQLRMFTPEKQLRELRELLGSAA